jgi:hypothetical protein
MLVYLFHCLHVLYILLTLDNNLQANYLNCGMMLGIGFSGNEGDSNLSSYQRDIEINDFTKEITTIDDEISSNFQTKTTKQYVINIQCACCKCSELLFVIRYLANKGYMCM